MGEGDSRELYFSTCLIYLVLVSDERTQLGRAGTREHNATRIFPCYRSEVGSVRADSVRTDRQTAVQGASGRLWETQHV